jgi:hypothetical protein
MVQPLVDGLLVSKPVNERPKPTSFHRALPVEPALGIVL